MKLTSSALRTSALSVIACMAMTACSGIPTKTFEFQSIDIREVNCPSMIVVNDDWDTAIAEKQVFDGTKMERFSLKIPFARPTVMVRAVPLPDGNVPKSRGDHPAFQWHPIPVAPDSNGA